ncbi:hypothetical protein ACYSNO_11800 [Enterococcus sp. LJL98]
MKRGIERKLILALGIWQIIDGLVTIFYYGLYKFGFQLQGSAKENVLTDTMQSSLFTLTTTFGILLITLGIANFVVSQRYLKDNRVNKKTGYFLIIQALFSYVIFDLISVVISMSAAVILLSKNKSIKKMMIIK